MLPPNASREYVTFNVPASLCWKSASTPNGLGSMPRLVPSGAYACKRICRLLPMNHHHACLKWTATTPSAAPVTDAFNP